MKIKYLLLCGLLFACVLNIPLFAQSMPPGQLSRQTSGKKPVNANATGDLKTQIQELQQKLSSASASSAAPVELQKTVAPPATTPTPTPTPTPASPSLPKQAAPVVAPEAITPPAVKSPTEQMAVPASTLSPGNTPAAPAGATPPAASTPGNSPAVPEGTAAPAEPEVTLTMIAARDRAAAAAKDADSFVTKVKSDIATATSQATTPSDYKKISDSAPFGDGVVAAATLAHSFSNLAANEIDSTKAMDDAEKAAEAEEIAHQEFTSYLDGSQVTADGCVITSFDNQGNSEYRFKSWMPLVGSGCNDAAVLAYYNVGKTTTIANQAQYLYNAAQSTSQVNADLLTTTFSGGIQVVLAGTATAGSSQPAASANGTASTTATPTDSVATAVAKLEQGGDFNLRLAYPLAQYAGSKLHYTMSLFPNLGFAVNGLSSQATITESTDYTGNIPLEFYSELGSIPNAGTAAVMYADAKMGGEFLASDLASKIGTNSTFFLGQFSAGIEFEKSLRIGFQYFVGPKQAYCVPNTSGCTAVTGSMSGVHLVVSFNPSSNK